MRNAPITVGLTLALFLAACSGPVTPAQAPEKEGADEAQQLTYNNEDGTDEPASASDGTTVADDVNATTETTGNETGAATSVEEKREFETDSSKESTSVADAITDIVASGSLLFVNPEWPHCEATMGVPAPEFSVPIKSASMNEDGYSSGADVSWQNVPEEEIVSYLKVLRDAGFVYGTSLSRASDSFSYSASDTDDETYTAPRRTVNLSYHQPYDEKEDASGYVLDISVWFNRGDVGSTFAYPESSYAEDVIAD